MHSYTFELHAANYLFIFLYTIVPVFKLQLNSITAIQNVLNKSCFLRAYHRIYAGNPIDKES